MSDETIREKAIRSAKNSEARLEEANAEVARLRAALAEKAREVCGGYKSLVPDVAQALRESVAEAWADAGDMAACYGAPVMRDDAERGFYVACENLRDEYRKKAAQFRVEAQESPNAK